MLILNGMFCGDNHSFDYTPTHVPNINHICITNGIIDELFASRNTLLSYDESSKKWDFDTILYALFKGNLFAGNVDFPSGGVTALRIKRRKKGEFNWITLFEIPIERNEDFKFERFDRYARGSTEYEYTLVPVINDTEGNMNTNSILSEFEGFYFIEKELIYQAALNTKLSTERNHTGTTVNTLGRKYPFFISSGESNYNSGQLEATFIDRYLNLNYDVDNGWKFREAVDDFLTNGKPKILKNDEGKMWMVVIVDTITQDFSSHWQMPIHTIGWSEVGDPEDVDDLYDNDFLEIDSRAMRLRR